MLDLYLNKIINNLNTSAIVHRAIFGRPSVDLMLLHMLTGSSSEARAAVSSPDPCLRRRCDDDEQSPLLGETGVDCGGLCASKQGKTCAAGVGCRRNGDCQSGRCAGSGSSRKCA